jgi:hypothetical protein
MVTDESKEDVMITREEAAATNEELTTPDAWDFFMAALKAVVPEFEALPEHPPSVEFHSGRQLWNWVVNTNPLVAQLIDGLDDEQISMVKQVLDGMLRERTGGDGGRVVSLAPLNISIGTT